MEALNRLNEVIRDRRSSPVEGSYTCYLFEQGLDKILKKCGEECSEVIIAAKSLEALAERNVSEADSERIDGARLDLMNEVCDLIYHLQVLLVQADIPLDNIGAILDARALKIGNLKKPRSVDIQI